MDAMNTQESLELIKTCRHGHAVTQENTYHYPEHGRNAGKTMCRECMGIWSKRQNFTRTKEQRNASARLWRVNNPESARRVRKKQNLKRFGLTEDSFNVIMVKQNGVCAICKNPEPAKRALAIDHNHQTGKIRGLLCTRCNQGIGCFVDQPLILEAAIKYLQER